MIEWGRAIFQAIRWLTVVRRLALYFAAIPALLAAVPAAADNVAAPATPSRQGPADPGAGQGTVTVTPATILLDAGKSSDQADIDIVFKVDPTVAGAAVTVAADPGQQGDMILVASASGAPMVDLDATGTPTGDVRQRVHLAFSNIPRRLAATGFTIRASIGKLVRSLPISVANDNAAPSGAALQLQLASKVDWSASGVPFTLIARGGAAPNISLAAGPFSNAATNGNGPFDLCLATDATKGCADGISLGLNEARPLFLISRFRQDVSAGSYSGTVRVLSSNGSEVDQSLTVNVSSGVWVAAGLIALGLGVGVSFWLTVYAPFQSDRALALFPFTELESRLEAAKGMRRPFDTPNLDDRSNAARESMQPGQLIAHNMLLPRWPTADGSLTDRAALNKELDRLTPIVTAIEQISRAIQLDAGAHTPGLDGIAASEKSFPPADVPAAIAGVVQAVAARMAPLPPEPLPTAATIVYRETAQNLSFWIIVSALTIAVGYVLLIANNPAYGGVPDLLSAFLWGIGLPAAGGKLADLNPGSIRTGLRPGTKS